MHDYEVMWIQSQVQRSRAVPARKSNVSKTITTRLDRREAR